MTNRSKAKGSSGEYQVRDLMQPVVNEVYNAFGLPPPVLERNLEQTRHGGSDLIGLDWLAVEVKWHKTDGGVNQWWAQVKAAAKPYHNKLCGTPTSTAPVCACGARERTPVLVYRGNNQPWQAMMFGYLLPSSATVGRVRTPMSMPVEAYLAWLRLEIRARLDQRVKDVGVPPGMPLGWSTDRRDAGAR